MTTLPAQSSSFVELAPLRAQAAREIASSRERLFDTLADAEGWERWFPGTRRCEWLTPAPHGVDSQRRIQVETLNIVERFIVWERPRRWGFTFVEATPPFADAGVELVELDDLGADRTLVTYTMALRPKLPLGPFTGPATRALEARLAGGLAALDEHVGTHG